MRAPMPSDPPQDPEHSIDPATLERLRRGFPLRMDRRGAFFFEDDEITHPGVVRLFRRQLDASASGEPVIELEGKWVYLEVADLPLRALRVDRSAQATGVLRLLLDDGRCVPLAPDTLWEEAGLGLRCEVPARTSGRPLAVRLSNSAAMDLSHALLWPKGVDEEARPELEIAGRRWPIPDHPPRARPAAARQP